MPRVSVVIPTHNRPVLLVESLASLRGQTMTEWEAIVVDDASSPPVALDEADKRIRIIRHSKSQGGAAAKNTGIQEASGEILAFLDDDDLYDPTYIEKAVNVLDKNPALDVIFMGVAWFGSGGEWGQRNYDEAMLKMLAEASGEIIEDEGTVLFGEELITALLKSVPMAFQRPVVRKSALDRIGIYRDDCLLWDCDWAISAALNAKCGLLQEGLYQQRAEGQGYSSRRDRRQDHLDSGAEIKDRFLKDARSGRYPQHLIPRLKKAAAKAWFDLAWHHYNQRNHRKAFNALWVSELRQVNIQNMKLLVRLLFSSLGIR